MKESGQTTPGGPLIEGYMYLIHNNKGRVEMPRTSFYVNGYFSQGSPDPKSRIPIRLANRRKPCIHRIRRAGFL